MSVHGGLLPEGYGTNPQPPCKQTDSCKNITFLQLRLRAAINQDLEVIFRGHFRCFVHNDRILNLIWRSCFGREM